MIDERATLLCARQGDATAFAELVACHQAAVFNVCLRLLGDRGEAEDAAQEAFLRAYQRLHTFDLSRPFGPWMRTVAANHCYNRLEARKPPHEDIDELAERVVASSATPEQAVLRAETEADVRQAVLQLPPQFRLVIELRHFQELSYEEIAEVTGLSLSTVKTHLFRARKLLATMIQRE